MKTLLRCAAVLFLAGAALPAMAQKYFYGLTGPECAQRGGTIRVWTSTAGIQPQRGECYVPARFNSPSVPSSSGQRSIEAMQGALGILGGIADLMKGMEDNERRWVDELNDWKRQAAAETDARRRELLEEERARREREYLAAQRELEAAISARSQQTNPFGAPPGAGGANPFAAAPAGRCDGHFNAVIQDLKGLASSCGMRSERMESLADMITGPDADSTRQGIIHSTSDPELFRIITPGDDRWRAAGAAVEPNCRAPLLVRNQQEAFMECFRVYLCGLRAASCAQTRARQSKTMPCVAASQQCLATNPVPTEAPASAAAPR